MIEMIGDFEFDYDLDMFINPKGVLMDIKKTNGGYTVTIQKTKVFKIFAKDWEDFKRQLLEKMENEEDIWLDFQKANLSKNN